MNEDLRLLVLFHGQHELFLKEFREHKNRMLQFLSDIEACAAQLDDMNKGARISSVVGSSVGVVSGTVSIIGLALIPFTAGASLALIGVGAGLGALSGVNSIVTSSTEAGVNHTQKKKANETFEQLMKDINVVQKSLNEIIRQHFFKIQEKLNVKNILPSTKTASVLKGIDSIVDCFSAYRASKMVSELTESLGQAALKGPLALSKVARGGFIGLNALFIGLDVALIAKDSIALSKGSETEMSKFFRARAALWKSEIVSWQSMVKSLERGLKVANFDQSILEEPFA